MANDAHQQLGTYTLEQVKVHYSIQEVLALNTTLASFEFVKNSEQNCREKFWTVKPVEGAHEHAIHTQQLVHLLLL